MAPRKSQPGVAEKWTLNAAHTDLHRTLLEVTNEGQSLYEVIEQKIKRISGHCNFGSMNEAHNNDLLN